MTAFLEFQALTSYPSPQKQDPGPGLKYGSWRGRIFYDCTTWLRRVHPTAVYCTWTHSWKVGTCLNFRFLQIDAIIVRRASSSWTRCNRSCQASNERQRNTQSQLKWRKYHLRASDLRTSSSPLSVMKISPHSSARASERGRKELAPIRLHLHLHFHGT